MIVRALILVLLLGVANVWAAAADERATMLARAEVTEIWEGEPRVVQAGLAHAPPSDAVVLFDGQNLDAWESVREGAIAWKRVDDALEVVPRTGDIRTKSSFADIQLHIEWATPAQVSGESQGRGNSGVFLMDRYEVQILDSYENRTYSNGQAASIYKQHPPRVNASRGPGEWQTYDIIFQAPRFGKDGIVVTPAYVTVLHNGVLVQHHVPVQGPTEFIGKPRYEAHGPAPIRLQDHSNPVRYRNIWVREL